jgi:hypothetical protein
MALFALKNGTGDKIACITKSSFLCVKQRFSQAAFGNRLT